MKKPVITHDGGAGTAGKNVGSKFFDGLIEKGRVVDRDSVRPAAAAAPAVRKPPGGAVTVLT